MPKTSERSRTENPEVGFDLLFQAHYRAIYRYCVRRLGLSEAEDATADVFAVAWRRLDELPPDEAGTAWLFGVAHRVVGNRYRSRRRQTTLSARLQATTPDQKDHEVLETSADPGVELLLAALHELSATDQELLRLSSWDELSREEIATVLGINQNAVDQRLHRARSRLRVRFERLATDTSRPTSEEASAWIF
ncbi:MAG: sigma-70 family RNA polymerase sigma factor [Acidimicrobiia bacterium]